MKTHNEPEGAVSEFNKDNLKVGDFVAWNYRKGVVIRIHDHGVTLYFNEKDNELYVPFSELRKSPELVTYTITVPKNLYPFPPNAEVLVRDRPLDDWKKKIFLSADGTKRGGWNLSYPYCTTDDVYKQCILYEGNEHLEGTPLPEGTPKNPPKENPWEVTIETADRDVIATFYCKCSDDASYLSEAIEEYATDISAGEYTTPCFVVRGHEIQKH